jgi:hypothetical protein
MLERQDLRVKERWAYLFCHEDGLIDIMVGLIAMGFGLIIASDKVIFWLIFYIFGIGIWRASKQWIPNPRIRHVAEKRSLNKTILMGMLVANLMLLFILALILLNQKA